jgi:hypothetical protein
MASPSSFKSGFLERAGLFMAMFSIPRMRVQRDFAHNASPAEPGQSAFPIGFSGRFSWTAVPS